MRVVITGHKGQLGRALMARFPGAVGVDLPEIDLTQPGALDPVLQSAQPDLVVHCAAWTDVDGAARDPQGAYRTNGLGTQQVALAAAAAGATLAYISTNEVFDGTQSRPYSEFDSPNPINPYGQSKRAGEWFTQHLCPRFFIIRIAWLTAPGGRNFVHRILQLADERGALRVVTDEVANPTFVGDLAEAVVSLTSTRCYGIYHLTNSGHCSRYEYARKILEWSGRGQIPVEPITLADYPRPSTPPKFAPLANQAAAALGVRLRPWEEALQDFLAAHPHPAPSTR